MRLGEKDSLHQNNVLRKDNESRSESDQFLSKMFEPENLAQGMIYAIVLGKPKAKQRVSGKWRA